MQSQFGLDKFKNLPTKLEKYKQISTEQPFYNKENCGYFYKNSIKYSRYHKKIYTISTMYMWINVYNYKYVYKI